MIDIPNPNNFYSEKEMELRKEYTPELKKRLLNKLKDLSQKIENEEPFPDGKNMTLDILGDIDDDVENILNFWYY